MPAKIFIIDDDKELCDEMTQILTDEGYSITSEYDGLKGKEAVEKGGYDLLLLDLKIPGLSGFDVLKKIREKNVRIKVIIVSGRPQNNGLIMENAACNNNNKEEEDILKMADGIISKPFEVETILSEIKKILI